MSTKNDAKKLLEMIENCFVSQPLIRKFPLNVEYSPNYFPNNNLKPLKQKNDVTYSIIPTKEMIILHSNVATKFKHKGTLKEMLLYPIKSCGAFSVSQWPITGKGFKYDREWMIVNSQGTAFTQKHSKKLCLVRPCINMEKQLLTIKFKGNTIKL